MEWFFDGIGSQIIGIILSFIIGGGVGTAVGYKMGSNNRIKQKQNARDDARQSQIGSITTNTMENEGKENGKR